MIESVQILAMITLAEALKTGRLGEFIAQEEARGIGPADSKEVAEAIRHLATTPTQSGGRTSRSTSGGGSTEK
jgi:hypothetical protein